MNEQSENEEIKVPGLIGTRGCVLRGTCEVGRLEGGGGEVSNGNGLEVKGSRLVKCGNVSFVLGR